MRVSPDTPAEQFGKGSGPERLSLPMKVVPILAVQSTRLVSFADPAFSKK